MVVGLNGVRPGGGDGHAQYNDVHFDVLSWFGDCFVVSRHWWWIGTDELVAQKKPILLLVGVSKPGLAGRRFLRLICVMAQPKPKPVDPAELPELARATMRAAKFPMLATMDGDQARVRPVSPVRTDGFFVYVANLKSYSKTAELEANAKAELCYLDGEHQQVRITAVAEVVTDAAVIAEIWESNPLLRAYLGSPDNPELVLYRFVPNRVRFMREWALQYHEVPLRRPSAG